MGISIREADIDRDMAVIRATFNANRKIPASPLRFRWLYHDNPAGRARAWLAIDEGTGDVAGGASVFPCRIRLANGREVIGWNAADLSVEPRYRGTGVALALRRVVCDAIDRRESALLYSHANSQTLPAQLEAGCQRLGRMVRYAKPLRVRAGGPWLHAATAAGMQLMGIDSLVRVHHHVEWRRGLTISDDVSDLFSRTADRIGTAVVRDARYLDWRFQQHPQHQNEMLILRHDGRVTGYLVVSADFDVARVRDWLAETPEVWDQAFAALIREMRRRGLATISVTALETHPDLPRLRRFGFSRRSDFSTAVAYTRRAPADPRLLDPAAWYMTVGDRHG